MFCPSCGTRNPEGVRFCKTCGTDLSGRRAGAPAPQAAIQAPVPDTPAFARPTTAAHRHIGRGGVIAGIAAAVAIALVVAAGLRTNWFGLAQPHLTPGTYTFTSSLVDSSLASHTTMMVLSVAKSDSATFTFEGGQSFGGNARVSWAGRDHLYVQVPVTRASLGLGENSKPKFTNVKDGLKSITALSLGDDQPLAFSIHFVFPRGAPDSIVGTWAMWITDENGLPLQVPQWLTDENGLPLPYGDMSLFIWQRFEGDGSFRGGYVPSSDVAATVDSLKAGTFQGNSNVAVSGSWTKQDDGSFVLNTPYGSSINTFQYHR